MAVQLVSGARDVYAGANSFDHIRMNAVGFYGG